MGIIEIDFPAGLIEDCFKEAIDIATRLKLSVSFVCNDLKIIVYPNADLGDLMSEYKRVINDDTNVRIVFGMPKYPNK